MLSRLLGEMLLRMFLWVKPLILHLSMLRHLALVNRLERLITRHLHTLSMLLIPVLVVPRNELRNFLLILLRLVFLRLLLRLVYDLVMRA
jgi:hypothetical protein